jgi:hypothetical protein
MKLVHYALAGLVIVMGAFPSQAQQRPDSPAAPSVSEPQTAFSKLPGRWVRPDGGYVITIKSVDAGGKLDANYANPNPLPFYSATATEEGGKLKLFFELRAGGYNGSTYTLNYDAAGERLVGAYYQAVARQTFDVVFIRK